MPTIDPTSIFIASLLTIALGYVVRRVGLVTIEHGRTLAQIVINVTLPALILVTVPDIEFSPEFLLVPLVPIAHALLALAASNLLFRGRPTAERGVATICMMGFNNGLFAVPISRAIWGLEGVQLLAIFDIGNGLVIFGLSYVTAAFFGRRLTAEVAARTGGEQPESFHLVAALGHGLRTIVTSVPMVAFAVALVLNVTGWRLPDAATRAAESVAAANGALALLVLGIFQEFRLRRGDLAIIAPVLLVRYGLGAVIAVAAVTVLGTTALLRDVLAIATLLPVGMTVVPFSVANGFDTRLATTMANISVLISFALMWVIVGL